MHFKQDSVDARFIIRQIDDQSITVNDTSYTSPIWLHAETCLAPWEVQDINGLTVGSLQAHRLEEGSILVLGTGKNMVRPDDALYEALLQHGITLEAMATHAACRTYQLLLSELRLAAAALFPPSWTP